MRCERYHTGEIKYVKLLDGGLVDNYGLAGFTIARLARHAYGPLAPDEAVSCGGFLFLVVDSGRAPSGSGRRPSPALGHRADQAASDTATESGAVGSYSAFDDTMSDWRTQLVAWRCRLSEAERRKFGATPGWNCTRREILRRPISFDSSVRNAPRRSTGRNRLHLPADQVDMLIQAGRDALAVNPKFRAFLGSLGRRRRRRSNGRRRRRTAAAADTGPPGGGRSPRCRMPRPKPTERHRMRLRTSQRRHAKDDLPEADHARPPFDSVFA